MPKNRFPGKKFNKPKKSRVLEEKYSELQKLFSAVDLLEKELKHLSPDSSEYVAKYSSRSKKLKDLETLKEEILALSKTAEKK